jgi:hypothetical protein
VGGRARAGGLIFDYSGAMKGVRPERRSAPVLVLLILVPLGTLVASCSDLIGLSKLDEVACVADCGVDAGKDAKKGCASDADCKTKADPRCDVATGMCVACLPTDDNCTSGTFCNQFSDGTYECVSGCKVVSDCPALKGGGDLACCDKVCVDTSTTAGDCGGCHACSSSHMATITCSAGKCDGNCDSGFADCNKDKLTDGCEVDTETDPKNCGGCGMACSTNHITKVTCAKGTCDGACDMGYADCDSDKLKNGCEVDTTTDPANCGFCGNVCATCAMGKCTGGGCGRFMTGYTGAWSTAAANPFAAAMGISNYVPAASATTLYLLDGTSLDAYSTTTNTYTPLLAAPAAMPSYGSVAWFSNALWSFNGTELLRYDITGNTWSAPDAMVTAYADSQTTNDDSGNLWSFSSLSALLEYNVATGVATTLTLTTALTGGEPRITFDSCSGLLYFAGFNAAPFYSYDPATGTQATLPVLPASNTIQDGFCGDRSGHVFAVTNTATMYQYTISTGVWAAMPAGGPTGDFNSACGVGADGFLYATDPETATTMYRIQLE